MLFGYLHVVEQVWTQQGSKLTGLGDTLGGNQGASVALSADGNTLVEGGPADNNNMGAIWIFTQSNGVWTQQGSKLIGSGANGNAPLQGRGVALSADGNTLAEGGYNDNGGAGAVWVFV